MRSTSTETCAGRGDRINCLVTLRVLKSTLLLLAFAMTVAAETVSSYRLVSDIAYLPEPRKERLDAWLPDTAVFSGPRPAVLLIHGGGWRIGDKADARERNIGATLAARGFVVFSINYLLNEFTRGEEGAIRHTKIAWPRNLEDCEAALHWVRTTGADAYHADPDSIVVMGGSAGGHLALLVAARSPKQIRGVVNLYGIYDLRRPEIRATSLPSAFHLAGEQPDETFWAAVSPAAAFTPEMPPVMVVHGTADKTVPVEHSRELARELERRKLRYVYVEIAGAPHSFHLQPSEFDLRAPVLAFLRQVSAPAAPR